MKLTNLIVFSGMILFLTACSYKPIGASMKSEELKESSFKNITVLGKVIDVENRNMWGRNKADEKGILDLENEFGLVMDSLFSSEGIALTITEDSLYKQDALDSLYEAMNEMNSIYSKKEKRQLGIIDNHPDFDFSNSEINIQSDLGLYYSISSYEGFMYISNGVGAGQTAIKQENTRIVSYLIDLSINKIVWVYYYNQSDNVERRNLDLYIKSLIMSLKYNRDIKPSSFDLKPSNIRYKITQIDGTVYYGSIISISGLGIEIKINGGQRSTNFGEIRLIETPGGELVFPFEI